MDARIARRRPGRAIEAGIAALLLGSAGVAHAGERWGSLGVGGGVVQWDPRLADYQWDVSPRSAWNAMALAGSGGIGGGVRVWGSGTTQSIDASSGTRAAVGAIGGELVGRGRIAEVWGAEVSASAGLGLMRLAYEPDRVTIPTGGTPIVVDLEPITAWTGSSGLALSHGLAGPWRAGLELEHRMFEIEAAHRVGGSIVKEREWFGNWSARLELARDWGRR